MQDPLKQGLKHIGIAATSNDPLDSNARSTKTRIETNFNSHFRVFVSLIRMQDPLKQGLKPIMEGIFSGKMHYSNARSTKTRIETGYLV